MNFRCLRTSRWRELRFRSGSSVRRNRAGRSRADASTRPPSSAPSSMTPPRSPGNLSNSPSRMSVPRKRQGELSIARKSFERMFSPPPRWSLTGIPLLWNARSRSRPPPPTCSTNGTPESLSVCQNSNKSGWVGDRSPAAVEGTWIAAEPRSMASRSVLTARLGSTSGTNATGSRRGSSLQKSTTAWLWAALPA